ncbi:hypothetical protein B0O99DRAFT_737345 [Bisporella sp. PMI_857]|nr:hypothetical protein B0O99DRAFT_737345 [Bisporella sp. PMI_857]
MVFEKIPSRVNQIVPLDIQADPFQDLPVIIAKRRVEAGETICELPRPLVIVEEMGRASVRCACNYCLGAIFKSADTKVWTLNNENISQPVAFITCDVCNIVNYWSQECKERALDLHKYECRIHNDLKKRLLAKKDNEEVSLTDGTLLFLYWLGRVVLQLVRFHKLQGTARLAYEQEYHAEINHLVTEVYNDYIIPIPEDSENKDKVVDRVMQELDSSFNSLSRDQVELYTKIAYFCVIVCVTPVFRDILSTRPDYPILDTAGYFIEPFCTLFQKSCCPNAKIDYEPGGLLRVRATKEIENNERITVDKSSRRDECIYIQSIAHRKLWQCRCSPCISKRPLAPVDMSKHLLSATMDFEMEATKLTQSSQPTILKEIEKVGSQRAKEIENKGLGPGAFPTHALCRKLQRATQYEFEAMGNVGAYGQLLKLGLKAHYMIEPHMWPRATLKTRLQTLYNIVALINYASDPDVRVSFSTSSRMSKYLRKSFEFVLINLHWKLLKGYEKCLGVKVRCINMKNGSSTLSEAVSNALQTSLSYSIEKANLGDAAHPRLPKAQEMAMGEQEDFLAHMSIIMRWVGAEEDDRKWMGSPAHHIFWARRPFSVL